MIKQLLLLRPAVAFVIHEQKRIMEFNYLWREVELDSGVLDDPERLQPVRALVHLLVLCPNFAQFRQLPLICNDHGLNHVRWILAISIYVFHDFLVHDLR